MAEIAAIRRNPRLVVIQRRFVIGEIVTIGRGGQTAGHDTRRA